ncbi:MAG: S26 family signal peptidase [Deltaproteobacteria bacterium]|nr:S26 family signal peptidase [Deltaproteobacteria bacterium]
MGPDPGLRVEMAREHLARGRSLPLLTSGYSMWPLIRPGRRVQVRPCGPRPLRRGDVVLIATPTDPVLHRVLAVRADAILTKGDAVRHDDGWVPRRDVLGRLDRRPWDGAVARASPGLARPLAIALVVWRTIFDRPWGPS